MILNSLFNEFMPINAVKTKVHDNSDHCKYQY